MNAPPSIIDSSYVRAYAIVTPDVQFTGKQCIYVGDELVGPAACLVITQNAPHDYLLFLCDSEWNSYACTGAETPEELISRAEKWYVGIDSKWVFTHFTLEEDRQNMKEYYAGEECSFCGKLPTEYDGSFPSGMAVICFECVERLHKEMIKIKANV